MDDLGQLVGLSFVGAMLYALYGVCVVVQAAMRVVVRWLTGLEHPRRPRPRFLHVASLSCTVLAVALIAYALYVLATTPVWSLFE
ncbi:MAG TPA: hypothetical protein VIG64_05210 [Actinomycetota bacterium]|jgi:hypothetical protein